MEGGGYFYVFHVTLAMVAALGPGLRNLVVALCINTTVGFTRVVRAAVLSIVNQDYISAANKFAFIVHGRLQSGM